AEVHHHVGAVDLRGPRAAAAPVPRHHPSMRCGAAGEDHDLMPALREGARQDPPDLPAAAGEDDLHRCSPPCYSIEQTMSLPLTWSAPLGLSLRASTKEKAPCDTSSSARQASTCPSSASAP